MWKKSNAHEDSTTPAHLDCGRKGEELALKLLQKEGYRIIERNFRCPFGEIDVVARDGKTVVFVEVKARESGRLSPPYLAVGKAKRMKIKKSARYYLNRKRAGQVECRFDIVSITFDDGPACELIRGAF
ncbi:MAG: YraN family protein [Nitrospinae bacterium]|nr:YraN family protein [Nitrospinota bacterium]